MATLQLFPEELEKCFDTSLFGRLFEICATVVLWRLAMLQFVDTFVHFLHTTVEGWRAKESLYQFPLSIISHWLTR